MLKLFIESRPMGAMLLLFSGTGIWHVAESTSLAEQLILWPLGCTGSILAIAVMVAGPWLAGRIKEGGGP